MSAGGGTPRAAEATSIAAPHHRRAWARLGLLGSLYFSQGLPFGFFTQALPLLLRKSGWSLGSIGLSSLLALPWALKFLWAPVVDRYGSARFGRRRSWIVPLQLLTALLLAALAGLRAFAPAGGASSPGAGLAPSDVAGASTSASGSSGDLALYVLLGAVLLVNLLAATQDIATDGLAVDMLAPSERGLANGLQVGAYRFGMIIGGGALLILFDRTGWAATFGAMALLVAVASAPVVLMREPSAAASTGPEPRPPGPAPGARAPTAPVHFLRRRGAASAVALLVVYKAGEAFATGMLRPFLADRGLGLADVGELVGTIGFVAGLVGALIGGALVSRVGRKRSLIAFGVLQASAVAAYAVVAAAEPTRAALAFVIGLEHLASGMATAALFTAMMDWCLPETSATDYTVQASAVVIATGAASSLAGFSAEALGWPGHFALATALALVAVFAAARSFPEHAPHAVPLDRSIDQEAPSHDQAPHR